MRTALGLILLGPIHRIAMIRTISQLYSTQTATARPGQRVRTYTTWQTHSQLGRVVRLVRGHSLVGNADEAGAKRPAQANQSRVGETNSEKIRGNGRTPVPE